MHGVFVFSDVQVFATLGKQNKKRLRGSCNDCVRKKHEFVPLWNNTIH